MSAGSVVAAEPRALTLGSMPRWASLGILFGLLSGVSIVLWGPIGVSGTYPRVIGSVLRRVTPEWAASNPYLVKMGTALTPETMLLIGLVIGAVIARFVFRSPQAAPVAAAEFVHANETTRRRRYVNAFLGGVLILFGARLAGGCTSGHIISGITQLSISSMIFAAGVFGAGIFTAKTLRGAN